MKDCSRLVPDTAKPLDWQEIFKAYQPQWKDQPGENR